MAPAFTRVTLVGPRKHVDLLLPSDQPVGLLLPLVLKLLEDPPADQVAAKVLVAADGTELGAGRSLDQARILDGSFLLLCDAAEAPPAAVVYDITDLVVTETLGAAGRWNRRCSALTAGTFAAAGFWAGTEVVLAALAPGSAWWILLALSLLGLAAGTAAGCTPRGAALSSALLGAGWLAGLGSALHLRGGAPGSLPAAALVLTVVSVLVLTGLGAVSRQPRVWVSGAATLVLAAGMWAAAGVVAGSPVRAAALAALAAVLLLSLLPKLALASSGLAALDDQRAAGGSIARTDARNAVAAAHQGLTVGTGVTALSIGLGLWLLGTDTGHQGWTLPLLLVLILAVFLRARSFPLAAQRLALYLAVAVGVSAAVPAALRVLAGYPWAVGLAVLLTSAAALTSLTAVFPDHAQARFRLLAKRAETLAVLASVPLTAGMFGVFGHLAESFS